MSNFPYPTSCGVEDYLFKPDNAKKANNASKFLHPFSFAYPWSINGSSKAGKARIPFPLLPAHLGGSQDVPRPADGISPSIVP